MQILTQEQLSIARVRLAQAEEAYHSLLTGRSVASFEDQNGEKVSYSKSDIGRLETYIATLKASLGLMDYDTTGPMGVYF